MGVGSLLLASCADTDLLNGYAGEKTKNQADYEYLNAYSPLKEYVSDPNFKLGIALAAGDYNQKSVVYNIANSNFTEVVTGNDMKMASIVKDNGSMDFSTVTEFITNAADNGLNIYGHTLAWHAQQPNKYLNGLIKDKELDVDPTKKNEVEVTTVTYNDGPFPFFPMGCEPPVINGSIHFVPTGDWSQFFCGNVPLTEGDFGFKVRIKSTMAGTVTFTIQNGWGGDAQNMSAQLKLEEGWNDVVAKFDGITASPSANYDLILKPETFMGTLDLNKIDVVKYEAPAIEVETLYAEHNYPNDGPFPYYQMGCAPPIVNGSIHFVPTGDWSQFFVNNAFANMPEGNYKVVLRIKSTKAGNIKLTAQNGWGGDAQQVDGAVKLVEGWTDAVMKFDLVGGNYDFILKPETFDATIDLNSVTIYKIQKMNKIPLTPEEKHDTLAWAMDRWISGMMKATEGKVKAWDLVNEAISGGNADSEGAYALQHKENVSPEDAENNFYWQDYLGDLDYVRVAAKSAREAYAAIEGANPADLKLFINDYNLETGYDHNQKASSLVKWIQRWESDGVTKIDGIGSQMHISCYEDPNALAGAKAAIENMYKILVDSKKLIRVSEFDMDFVDKNGKKLKTDALTEEQHKIMADYWKWNIETYKKLVPANQQWGFCSWCMTDSPDNSGWRAGMPTGLWDKNYYRKHTYGGFADGLQGK